MDRESANQAYQQFYSCLGFDDNPFAHTNADQEERLPSYFIPPPYFDAVFGDPAKPKSFLVFAPRGGGKSAQRRMIEYRCHDKRVLAITYDQFEFPEIGKVSELRLHHHLRRILRFSLIGLLVNLHSEPALKEKLSKYEKQIFLKLAAEHLGNMTTADFQAALNSLKSFQDKFKEFWNDWLPAIGIGLRALLALLKPIADLADISQLSQYSDPEFKASASLKHQLSLVVELARKFGWQSIYVLVDRVDESELTGNNAKDSVTLLEPMLRDLPLLEFPGLGFKFFLWDSLKPMCKDIVRTDRVEQETLFWDKEMLRHLWRKRLLAFSAQKVDSLDQISEMTRPFPVDELAFTFANHSPRDLIRIGRKILSEQQELDPDFGRISKAAVYTAIEKFCSQRASEIITKDRVLQELKKVRQVDFTIPYLANEVFREKQATTRTRLVAWREEEAIVDVERIDDPKSKQEGRVKLFAIKDIRVAKEIYPELSIPQFLEQKFKKCPKCDAIVLRDWGDIDSSTRCDECQCDLGQTKDDLEDWRRRALAAQRREQYREVTVNPQSIQLSLFGDVSKDAKIDEGDPRPV